MQQDCKATGIHFCPLYTVAKEVGTLMLLVAALEEKNFPAIPMLDAHPLRTYAGTLVY